MKKREQSRKSTTGGCLRVFLLILLIGLAIVAQQNNPIAQLNKATGTTIASKEGDQSKDTTPKDKPKDSSRDVSSKEAKEEDTLTTGDKVKNNNADGLICEIGDELFSREHIMSEIPSFIEAMKGFSWPKNNGGTLAPHRFALWCIIRHLKPKHIVESGAFKGLGTWLLRQAAPDAQITVVSPEITALYTDQKDDTVYYTGDKFKDFASLEDAFSGFDKEKTLLFFDDHQSGLIRAKQAFQMGFRHLVYDDNYTPQNGDNFSLKQACDESGKMHKLMGATPVFKSDFGKESREISMDELSSFAKEMKDIVDLYYEFPPLWDMSVGNRFNINPEVYRKITKASILDNTDTLFSKVTRMTEGPSYTWMNYAHLKSRS